MNKPLVSIITGFYNREDYVYESIQSLIDQSYPNIEIIAFDDASTDNTYRNLLSIQCDKLKIIKHKQNIGFVNGLINAIDMAQGQYIAIHGSGDISKKDRILKQVDFLINNADYGVVGCYVENYDKLRERSHLLKPKIKIHRFYGYAKAGYTHGEIMFTKEAYLYTGGYRSVFRFGQMTDLIYRMSLRYELGLVNEVLYHRKSLDNGVSANIDKKILQKYYLELAKVCIKQKKKSKFDIIEKYGANYHIVFGGNKKFLKAVLRLFFSVKKMSIEESQAFDDFVLLHTDFCIEKMIFYLLRNKIINKPIATSLYNMLNLFRKAKNRLIFKTVE